MRFFDPWVGSEYRDGGLYGLRVLILGESHYDSSDKLRESYTIDCIRDIGQRRRFRFFTVVQSLMQGTRGGVSDAERAAFWERVAYCNFVQKFAAPGPRVAPTPEMWSAGGAALVQTVGELSPHLVVALGERLWPRLPELPAGVSVCEVRHPSGRGFRYADWQPVVRKALVAAGGTLPAA